MLKQLSRLERTRDVGLDRAGRAAPLPRQPLPGHSLLSLDANHSGVLLRRHWNTRSHAIAQVELAVQSAPLDCEHSEIKQADRSGRCLCLQSRTRTDNGGSVTGHRHL